MDYEEDWGEETIEAMAVDDEDASLIWHFENALMDTIQDDKELATYYVSYQDARRRLLEKQDPEGLLASERQQRRGFGKFSKASPKNSPIASHLRHAACSSSQETPQVPTSFVVSLESTLKDIPTASSETSPSFTNACFSLFNAVCRSTQISFAAHSHAEEEVRQAHA